MIQPNKNGKAYENEKNYSDGYDGHAPYSKTVQDFLKRTSTVR